MSELFFGLFDNPNLGLSFSGDGSAPPEATPTSTPTPAEPKEVPAMTIDLGHVYHVTYPKCDENSARGIRYAHQHGWSIDLDMQKDKLGNIMNDHWQDLIGQDKWYDPRGILKKGHLLRDMTPAQWGHLTTTHGDELWTMDQALHLCGRLGVKARIEPKVGNHWTLEDAQHLHAVAQEANATVVVATLTNDANWLDRLRLFRQAGFPDCRRL